MTAATGLEPCRGHGDEDVAGFGNGRRLGPAREMFTSEGEGAETVDAVFVEEGRAFFVDLAAGE